MGRGTNCCVALQVGMSAGETESIRNAGRRRRTSEALPHWPIVGSLEGGLRPLPIHHKSSHTFLSLCCALMRLLLAVALAAGGVVYAGQAALVPIVGVGWVEGGASRDSSVQTAH